VEDRRRRWQETDPWDVTIECSEETWSRKTALRPELVAHEPAVCAVLRRPDALFLDEFSTERRRALGHLLPGVIVHYVGGGRGRGPFADKLLCVVVKWLASREQADVAHGYVSTVYFAADVQPRLRLVWEREP
jgi:hypothetical protein